MLGQALAGAEVSPSQFPRRYRYWILSCQTYERLQRLSNPVGDGERFREALLSCNVLDNQIVTTPDFTRQEIFDWRDALEDANRDDPNWNVIFIACHAYEADGNLFLCPRDSHRVEDDFPLHSILRRLSSEAGVVLFLATCRERHSGRISPLNRSRLQRRFQKSQQRGPEVFFMYACEPGDELPDQNRFTTVLCRKLLASPEADLYELSRQVGLELQGVNICSRLRSQHPRVLAVAPDPPSTPPRALSSPDVAIRSCIALGNMFGFLIVMLLLVAYAVAPYLVARIAHTTLGRRYSSAMTCGGRSCFCVKWIPSTNDLLYGIEDQRPWVPGLLMNLGDRRRYNGCVLLGLNGPMLLAGLGAIITCISFVGLMLIVIRRGRRVPWFREDANLNTCIAVISLSRALMTFGIPCTDVRAHALFNALAFDVGNMGLLICSVLVFLFAFTPGSESVYAFRFVRVVMLWSPVVTVLVVALWYCSSADVVVMYSQEMFFYFSYNMLSTLLACGSWWVLRQGAACTMHPLVRRLFGVHVFWMVEQTVWFILVLSPDGLSSEQVFWSAWFCRAMEFVKLVLVLRISREHTRLAGV